MNGILIAAGLVAAIGLFIGLFLGVASEKFKVEVDEKEVAVRAELPGNNCGGCGYAGCDALAAAICKGDAPVDACPVGGGPVGAKIAAIMGVEVTEKEREVAFVRCNGKCNIAHIQYAYYGIHDCRDAMNIPGGGDKECSYGCSGLGSCVKVCEFDAVHIIDGVAKVDPEKCKACGKCVSVCPKKVITLVPYGAPVRVKCINRDKGPLARKVCETSCIACGICEKKCPSDAIHVINGVAQVDYSKCSACGTCVKACPRKAIHDYA